MNKFIATLTLTLAFYSVNAQFNGWQNITNTNFVRSLYNDGDTLWVGTQGGLIKYNKRSGTNICYNHANSGLPSNYVRGIAKDRSNNIWVACEYEGIACLKNGSCQVYKTRQYSTALYIDNMDTVYVGPTHEFVRIHQNVTKTITTVNPLYSMAFYVTDIIAAKDSGLIVASNYGLYRYVNGSFILFQNQKNSCTAVEYDKTGKLWVATAGDGIYKYEQDTFYNYNSTNSQVPNNIVDLDIDSNNTLWLADGVNLIKFKEDGCTKYDIKIKPASIFTILCDDTCIWVGTTYNGLFRFSNDNFNHTPLFTSNLPSNNNVKLQFIDSTLLLASDNKILELDSNVFKTLVDTAMGLKINPISMIYPLKDKGIFIVGGGEKLCCYKNGTYRYYDNFINDNIKSIAAISADTFWVATSNRGLLRYQTGQVTEFNSTNSSLPNNYINEISFDKNGLIWGAYLNNGTSTPGGIFSFNGTNWKIWSSTQIPQLSSSKTTSLCFDSKNNLWCLGKDFTRYDGTNWKSFGTASGISRIFVDFNDTIWLATMFGAEKFDGESKWEDYTMNNSGLTFNMVSDIVRLTNGKVYFAHSNCGLSVLNYGIKTITSNINSNFSSNSFDIEAYPNPVDDMLTIRFPKSGLCSYKLMLYDITGRSIFSKQGTKSSTEDLTVNTSVLPKGVYLLKLTTDNGTISKKIMKL